MRISRLIWVAPVLLVALAWVPVSSATTPVTGPVTTCASTVSCTYDLNSTVGAGWASTSGGLLSFQLPGEAKASYNLSYSTYTESLTGTYTYWTVGNFVGTDANTGYVVYGSTNTNYTITCHGHSGRGGGCSYTYTTDNGTIVFKFTAAEMTSTAISCSPTSLAVGAKTTCKVTVANLWNSSNVPTGTLHLATPGLGAFSNHGTCKLTSGSCSITWRPSDNTIGTVAIAANYPGTPSFYLSAGTTSVVVTGDSGGGD